MVVYLPSLLTWKPVLASFLKGGSEDTLSVSGSSRGIAQGSCGRPLIAKPHEQSIAMGGAAGCDLIKVSGIVGACWHQNSA
jgi:hypothetical protein